MSDQAPSRFESNINKVHPSKNNSIQPGSARGSVSRLNSIGSGTNPSSARGGNSRSDEGSFMEEGDRRHHGKWHILDNAKYTEAEDEEEESEGKYKLVRHHVEKFFKQSKFGKWIEISMGFLSFLSSVTFVVMTYWDLS